MQFWMQHSMQQPEITEIRRNRMNRNLKRKRESQDSTDEETITISLTDDSTIVIKDEPSSTVDASGGEMTLGGASTHSGVKLRMNRHSKSTAELLKDPTPGTAGAPPLSSVFTDRIKLLCLSASENNFSLPNQGHRNTIENAYKRIRSAIQEQEEQVHVADRIFVQSLCEGITDEKNPAPRRLSFLKESVLEAYRQGYDSADRIVEKLMLKASTKHTDNLITICKVVVELVEKLSERVCKLVWENVIALIDRIPPAASQEQLKVVTRLGDIIEALIDKRPNGVNQPFVAESISRRDYAVSRSNTRHITQHFIAIELFQRMERMFELSNRLLKPFQILNETSICFLRKEVLLMNEKTPTLSFYVSFFNQGRIPQNLLKNPSDFKENLLVVDSFADSAGMRLSAIDPTRDFRIPIKDVIHSAWADIFVLIDQLTVLCNCKVISYKLLTRAFFLKRVSQTIASNNLFLYIIDQVLSVEDIKAAAVFDVKDNEGKYFTCVTELHDPSMDHMDETMSEVIFHSFDCFLWRLRSTKDVLLPAIDIQDLQSRCGKFWKRQVEFEDPSFDFWNPLSDQLIMVAILSFISSATVASKCVMEVTNSVNQSLCKPFPGQLLCDGHTKPLPVSLLTSISHQCRVKMVISLFKFIKSPSRSVPFTARSVMSFGVVETFVRVLLLCPQSMSKHFDQIISVLEHSPSEVVVYTLLEIVLCRLFNLFVEFEKLKHLFDITSIVFHNARHPMVRSMALCLLQMCKCHNPQGDTVYPSELTFTDQPDQLDFQSAVRLFEREDFQMLKEFGSCDVDLLKNHLEAHSDQKKYMLTAVACQWLSCEGSGFNDLNFQQIFSTFSQNEILETVKTWVSCITNAFVSKELDLFCKRVLDANIDTFQLIKELFEAFLFRNRFAPIDLTLFFVLEKEVDNFTDQLVNYLFFESAMELQEKVDFLCEKPLDYVNDDDTFSRHLEYHATFLEVTASSGQFDNLNALRMVPVYYSNLCIRLIPIFKKMMQRWFQNGNIPQFKRLTKCIAPFIRMYDLMPLRTVSEWIHSADDQIDRRFIKCFCKLVDTSLYDEIDGSLAFEHPIDASSATFCIHILARLQRKPRAQSVLLHEHLSELEEMVHLVALKLLSSKQTVQQIIEALIEATANYSPRNGSHRMDAFVSFGMLIGRLPKIYIATATEMLFHYFVREGQFGVYSKSNVISECFSIEQEADLFRLSQLAIKEIPPGFNVTTMSAMINTCIDYSSDSTAVNALVSRIAEEKAFEAFLTPNQIRLLAELLLPKHSMVSSILKVDIIEAILRPMAMIFENVDDAKVKKLIELDFKPIMDVLNIVVESVKDKPGRCILKKLYGPLYALPKSLHSKVRI